jgi:medium-chain acyl-[acyl-carrier-protein] hydrolase
MYFSKWFHFERPNPRSSVRLFCFPYAGGGSAVFRAWCDELPNKVEVVAIRLPGRENRIDEEPIGSLDCLVEALYENIISLLDKPCAFFGHSNGALICYKLALRLERYCLSVAPKMLILSAKCPPHFMSEKENLSLLPDDEFLDKLSELNGTPKEILENREMMGLLLPMLRADFSLAENLDFEPDVTLKCPVTVFYSPEDEISFQKIAAWQDLFSEKISFHEFSGGHFFIHEQRSQLLAVLSEELNKMSFTQGESGYR